MLLLFKAVFKPDRCEVSSAGTETQSTHRKIILSDSACAKEFFKVPESDDRVISARHKELVRWVHFDALATTFLVDAGEGDLGHCTQSLSIEHRDVAQGIGHEKGSP